MSGKYDDTGGWFSLKYEDRKTRWGLKKQTVRWPFSECAYAQNFAEIYTVLWSTTQSRVCSDLMQCNIIH